MIEAISPEFVPSRSSFLSFSTAMLSSEVILDGHFFVRLLAEAESSVEASLLTCREAMTFAHESTPSNTAARNFNEIHGPLMTHAQTVETRPSLFPYARIAHEKGPGYEASLPCSIAKQAVEFPKVLSTSIILPPICAYFSFLK